MSTGKRPSTEWVSDNPWSFSGSMSLTLPEEVWWGKALEAVPCLC